MEKTCKDCKYFKYCLENGRLYPCKDFTEREGKKNDITGQRQNKVED